MRPLVKHIWLVNLVGNAVLVALFYLWLGIPDRRTWQLGLSAAGGLAIAFLALWLWTATLAVFRLPEAGGLGGLFAAALRRVPAMASLAAAVAVVLCLLAVAADQFPAWAAWLGSALTLRLRRPIKPPDVEHVLGIVRWLLAWVVTPVLALPLASALAGGGFRAYRTWHVRRLFWLEYLFTFTLAWYLPAMLARWVPPIDGTAGQVISFALRTGVAWFLIVAGWIFLAWASSLAPGARPAGPPGPVSAPPAPGEAPVPPEADPK